LGFDWGLLLFWGGISNVFWLFVGVFLYFGFLEGFIFCFLGGFLLSCGCLIRFYCISGFLGFFSFSFLVWAASWIVHMYTSCVLKSALHFFNKIFLFIKKNIGKYFYIKNKMLTAACGATRVGARHGSSRRHCWTMRKLPEKPL
jgi:hypothetical protein